MFQNVHIHGEMDINGRFQELNATIQWPFEQEEAPNWAEFLCPPGVFIALASISQIDPEEANKITDKSERRFIITQGLRLTCDSVYSLKTHFTYIAMPKIAALMKKIIKLVSPDSYKQALQILRSGKHVRT